MRLLVIQTAFIGDIVLTTPFLKILKQLWPGCTIDVVTTPAGRDILAGSPQINTLVLDKKNESLWAGIRAIRRQLRDVEYEVVFCVHRSARSLWIANLAHSKQKISFRSVVALALGFRTVLYPEYADELHYSKKLMCLLNAIEPKISLPVISAIRPELFETDSDRLWAKTQLARLANPIVISPFSVWGTKNWLPDRFAEVAARISNDLGASVVLVGDGSPECIAAGRTIESALKRSEKPYLNLIGQTSLSQLKSVVAQSTLVLANDSSAVHIAAAFNIPTVAIFGPTVKKWGFFPLSTKSIVVENTNLSCRPCHLHGPAVCPKTHFKCMAEIQVDEVALAVKRLLQT